VPFVFVGDVATNALAYVVGLKDSWICGHVRRSWRSRRAGSESDGEGVGLMRRWLEVGLVVAMLMGAATATRATVSDREQTRALMRRIFGSMQVLLPLSADPVRFADPARATAIRGALASLATNADALAEHAGSRNIDAKDLGSALSHDAREAVRFYDLGRMDGATFFLQQTTAHCVACHSRLPHPGDSPISADFLRDASLAKLPPLERARLLIATRRFDEALATYERVFADPSVHPIDMLSGWIDYLVVSLRAKQDFVRPVPVLERFAKRPDLWGNLRHEVRAWTTSVRALAPSVHETPSLHAARALLAQASERTRVPDDRSALVSHIAASGVLHRFLAAHPGQTAETGETYYLLGLSELHVNRDYWVSQADFFLESAIRTAPKQPFARDAYALLEQNTLFSYTGSSGVNLSDDVQRHLAELRKLIDAP
jgi:hypothetical protein